MSEHRYAGAESITATARWGEIIHGPDQSAYGRWCIGQATAHADRIATLSPPPGDSAAARTGLVVRNEAWHATALVWYTMLVQQPEPEQTPRCRVADRDAIRAWLQQPAPDATGITIADYLHLSDIPVNQAGSPTLNDLVELAQNAGLFGVNLHTIRVHTIIDHATGSQSHLIVVHTADGTALAAGPASPDQSVSWEDPVDAAVATLNQCSTYVDSALAYSCSGVE